MLDCSSAFAFFEMSADAQAGESYLVSLMEGAKLSLHLRMFGLTDTVLGTAFLAAHGRGVDCWAILDHNQFAVPNEASLVKTLLAGGFPADHLCITSDYGAGYMHEKELLVDAAATVDDATFTDVEAARTAGYPITVTGSTNWSHSAFYQQSNHLLVIPGKTLAEACLAEFTALFAWGRAHHPQYQQ